MFRTLNKEDGFTLIEMIIVIVIIGFLATMVGPNLFNRVSQAKQTSAYNQIDVFKLALDNYRIDNGKYPTTTEGLKVLAEDPGSSDSWAGPYVDKIPLDPWGNEYNYRFPGKNNSHKYDLWSYGADNKEGGTGENEDITNW
ncbi:type II secretion system major pseudopilin GspG [Orenia marismortui]|uniref:type II secretion system major pseudopilin GspG n=1 Tax=Orenia marismortui TaxID=46469 RepID=UPI0003661BC6|nr:type II secretion system major pseudopilin GspG [Orenia marismortui]